jgi:hypothetical protein
LAKEIDIDHLEIHPFFVKDDTAAVTERAGGSRIEIHHDQYPQKRIGIAAATGVCRALAGDAAVKPRRCCGYLMSFQYAFFSG